MLKLSEVLHDGLHLHRRCIATSVPAPAVTNHPVNRKAGIVWITAEQFWRGLASFRTRSSSSFARTSFRIGRVRRAMRFS